MAAGRSQKPLVGRRRRLGDEGDDDESTVMVSDSQSEGSILSNGEDEASTFESQGAQDGLGVEGTDAQSSEAQELMAGKKPRKARNKGKKQAVETSEGQSNFRAVADTEAMMNGLKVDDTTARGDMVDFEEHGRESKHPAQTTAAIPDTANGYTDSPAARQRRDHEEYRKKRDADPAFIPNRGTFFMHDTRGQANGYSGPPLRGAWQGRGRGRGGPVIGGPVAPAAQFNRTEPAAEQPWKHDLHDTINEESSHAAPTQPAQQTAQDQKDITRSNTTVVQPRAISFSSTTMVGKVSIRVSLPGMKEPISFSEVPWKHYTRLPNHRPPLRRDKPVRISIPPNMQRYIFPSPERSFIFIPRQLRPNQQGYGRGGYQRGWGGYGGSSRRTSMYGGSMYAASVAASRRSSIAGLSRADAFSPTSFGSGGHVPSNSRPVVRLPYGQQSFSGLTSPTGPMSGHHTPTGVPQLHTYPLPQQPTYQGTPTTTVHQPRPQKTISVTGIESPAVLQQVQTPMDHQPFQSQLPPHMHDQALYFSPRQQYSYVQQQAGTPLSGINEQALQATPFQPGNAGYGQAQYYPSIVPQQNYYYSPPGPNGYGPMPMYGAPTHGYMMPPQHSVPPQHPHHQHHHSQTSQPPSQPVSRPTEARHQHQPSQSGMVAHEQNGMVFYMPASEAQQQAPAENYQPAESFVPSYAMPGLPPPTPAPENAAYYNPVQMQSMPGVYYPPQQQ